MATQQFRGDLAGQALTNSAGDLLIQASPGRDVVIKLADDVGNRKVVVRDSNDVVVATITSEGENAFQGPSSMDGPLAFDAAAAPANDGEIGRLSGSLGYFEAGSFRQFRFVSLIDGGSPLSMTSLNLVAGTGISLLRTEGPTGQMNVTIIGDTSAAPEVSYRAIDPVTDAVQGQPNTYYVDKGATSHGHNVALDSLGTPQIELFINGRKKFLAPEADLGHPTRPADYAVVRSQSTGPEGSAAVGSRNAVKLAAPLSGIAWVDYRRLSQAAP